MLLAGAGALIGVLGGIYGARQSIRKADTEPRKRLMRKAALYGAVMLCLVMAVLTLSLLGHLPRWIYIAVLVVWFAALIPSIYWLNKRYAALEKN